MAKQSLLIVLLVGIVALVALGLIKLPAAVTTGAETTGAVTADCGDVTTTTESVRVKDLAASTLSWAGPTYYFQRTSDNVLEETGTAGATSAFVTETLNPCTQYKVFSINSAGLISSSDTKTFTTGKVGLFHTLDAYNMSYASIRVKDTTNDEYENLYYDDAVGAGNATTYSDLNTTRIYEDAAATDIAVGTDGKLEEKILIKSATTNTYFTDPNQKWWICVDEGVGGEWKEPSISFDGVRLTNAKSSMSPDDLTGSIVQAADWCYPVNKAVDDLEHTIDFIIQADSGQNPDTTDDDVTVSFLSEGTYVSSDTVDKVKTGVYTDASTQALSASGADYVPRIVFQIS